MATAYPVAATMNPGALITSVFRTRLLRSWGRILDLADE